MCNIKSAIVLKNKIYCPLDFDSHTEMLEKLGIKDTRMNPDFVRVEMIPADGDLFNHDLANWKLKVDQDFRPDWFCEGEVAESMKRYLGEFFDKRFIIDKTVDEVNEGRWFLKNGMIQKASGNAILEQMRWNSQVREMWGNSQVGVMWGNSTAKRFSWNEKAKLYIPKDAFEIVEVEPKEK